MKEMVQFLKGQNKAKKLKSSKNQEMLIWKLILID